MRFPHISLISEFSAYFRKMCISHIFPHILAFFVTKNIKTSNIEVLFSNAISEKLAPNGSDGRLLFTANFKVT